MKDIMNYEHESWGNFLAILNRELKYCHGDHRTAIKTLTENFPDVDVEKSIGFFVSKGGFCDCEILMNVDTPIQGEEEMSSN